MSRFQTKRLYYSISEVSKISGVPAYRIRKWEVLFPNLSPARNAKGNRIYTNKDISIILSIKKSTAVDGYTLEKTKSLLESKDPKKNDHHSENQPIVYQSALTQPHTMQIQLESLVDIKKLVAESLELINDLEDTEQTLNNELEEHLKALDKVKNRLSNM